MGSRNVASGLFFFFSPYRGSGVRRERKRSGGAGPRGASLGPQRPAVGPPLPVPAPAGGSRSAGRGSAGPAPGRPES